MGRRIKKWLWGRYVDPLPPCLHLMVIPQSLIRLPPSAGPRNHQIQHNVKRHGPGRRWPASCQQTIGDRLVHVLYFYITVLCQYLCLMLVGRCLCFNTALYIVKGNLYYHRDITGCWINLVTVVNLILEKSPPSPYPGGGNVMWGGEYESG